MHVAEGRRLFRNQSVRDNLELGLYGGKVDRAAEARRYEFVYDMFPMLRERPDDRAGRADVEPARLQMLAIAQALMREPRLLMLDEPSLGLAPVIVDQVIEAIVRLRAGGVTILLVEQMVERALDIADHAYVFQNGLVIGHGAPKEIRNGSSSAAPIWARADERARQNGSMMRLRVARGAGGGRMSSVLISAGRVFRPGR